MFRSVCLRCKRRIPLPVRVDPGARARTRVVVLQHPSEARHPLNTARLAVLGLAGARLLVGSATPQDWMAPGYAPHLLFPGPGARVLGQGMDGGEPARPSS